MKVVDVGSKPATRREAVARGRLSCGLSTLAAIEAGGLPKGDVLAAARLAGILAAKRTPELVPLCHPIRLTAIDVTLTLTRSPTPGVEIEARVRAEDRTGVEMEALAAVCGAALCAYDMLKARDRSMAIEQVALWKKGGGRTGTWVRKPAPKQVVEKRRRPGVKARGRP
jgi:cyclic pyranopterin phosphate synthase